MMPINCGDDWLSYKECVKESQVRCAELAVDVHSPVDSPHNDEPMEHLTQEDMVPHNEVHENEDDEEGGDDEECSYGSDGEDDFDRCGLNNNFGEHQDDEKEDGDDISVSSEEEEEPTPVSQPTPTPISQPTPTPLRQPTQPTYMARVNHIRQFSSLGEETPLFGERVDEASRGSVHTLSGF
jgi:hypothetical protein